MNVFSAPPQNRSMDPLEWLARMADHIPDAGKHRTHFYGCYAGFPRAVHRGGRSPTPAWMAVTGLVAFAALALVFACWRIRRLEVSYTTE